MTKKVVGSVRTTLSQEEVESKYSDGHYKLLFTNDNGVLEEYPAYNLTECMSALLLLQGSEWQLSGRKKVIEGEVTNETFLTKRSIDPQRWLVEITTWIDIKSRDKQTKPSLFNLF